MAFGGGRRQWRVTGRGGWRTPRTWRLNRGSCTVVLAMLRHHLSQTRVATSSKIRAEYVSRRQGNTQAVAVLQSNLELWLAVRGPDLQSLAEPSDETMRRAMVARDSLAKLQEKHAGIAAVGALKSMNFERIRQENFLATPESYFNELVKDLQGLEQHEQEAERRKEAWLPEVLHTQCSATSVG